MLTFLAVALLLYGSMHLYLLGKVWLAFPRSWALTMALVLAGLVLTLSPLLVWFLERQNRHGATVATAWVSYAWMGYVLLFVCIGLAFDLAHALARVLNLKWPLSHAMTLRIVGVLAVAVLGYGFVEAWQIRIEQVNIRTAKLESLPVTIAQLSDLHLGIMTGESFVDRVTAKLREIRPDIVVATGDLVDGGGDNLVALARRFHSYTPPLGAYAVTGNHEYYAGLDDSLRFLRDAGFTVLHDESAQAGEIVLVGVDEHGAATSARQRLPSSDNPLASAATHRFVVLLKHQPVVASETPFDLQLSGHMHGGQIFPFGYLTRLVYGVHTGLTRLADDRWLYVSRGTGTWGPPIRLLAPPEITLITIAGADCSNCRN